MISILKAFAEPLVWVLVLMVATLALMRSGRKRRGVRLGWYLLLAATIGFYLLGSDYVSNALLYTLESRYRPSNLQDANDIDAVVVLAGGALPASDFRPQGELLGITYARVAGGVAAFKKSGAELLVMSGGSASRGDEPASEVMKRFAIEMAVPADKIVAQTVSRTTAEDAAEVAKLLPGRGRRIGLATSALHMRRAERIFEAVFVNDEIVPIPVNYLYSPPRRKFKALLPSAAAIRLNSMVIHEYTGLLWYKLRYGF